ncbi:ATPase [Striga asiatica]|uniref:ATPase n=1 Tax=Striga asiatica TaxID=4170 RepID=A0A5A7QRP4_STRAF|nr:ATPase [Striga asiatica]
MALFTPAPEASSARPNFLSTLRFIPVKVTSIFGWESELEMGFLVTTLIFVVVGVIASLCTRICCNRGPSANLFFPSSCFNLDLNSSDNPTSALSIEKSFLVTSDIDYYCNSLLLDDVGNCVSITDEAINRSNFERV